MDLYSETILDHYQYPRNAGELSLPSIRVTEANPLCGDTLELDLAVSKGRLETLAFKGQGCAISQASMSLLGEQIKGRTLAHIQAIKPQDVLDLLHVPISPARKGCALLGFTALQKGVTLLQVKTNHD